MTGNDGERTLYDALDTALTAADGGCQATTAIWAQLSTAERDEWLRRAEQCWPHLDLFLPVILAAAAQIIEAERQAH